MVSIETVKFIGMLNELAELSAEGIKDFSEATQGNSRDMVFFDGSSPDEDGYFSVVQNSVVIDDPAHHDIVNYYDSDAPDYIVRAVIGDDGDRYILIKSIYGDWDIIVENGRWYFI